MANGDRIGSGERVVRYAKPAEVDGAFVNGSIFLRDPARKSDDDGISVCRRGVFSTDPVIDLDTIRTVLKAYRAMKPKGRLAEFSVSDIEAVGQQLAHSLSVIEDALQATDVHPANPAHALIDGLPFIGAEVGSLSAEVAGDTLASKLLALHPAV